MYIYILQYIVCIYIYIYKYMCVSIHILQYIYICTYYSTYIYIHRLQYIIYNVGSRCKFSECIIFGPQSSTARPATLPEPSHNKYWFETVSRSYGPSKSLRTS